MTFYFILQIFIVGYIIFAEKKLRDNGKVLPWKLDVIKVVCIFILSGFLYKMGIFTLSEMGAFTYILIGIFILGKRILHLWKMDKLSLNNKFTILMIVVLAHGAFCGL